MPKISKFPDNKVCPTCGETFYRQTGDKRWPKRVTCGKRDCLLVRRHRAGSMGAQARQETLQAAGVKKGTLAPLPVAARVTRVVVHGEEHYRRIQEYQRFMGKCRLA